MIEWDKIEGWADLNDRQKDFVLAYLKSKNGADAARKAGYAERNAAKTASTLLKDANIRKVMTAVQSALWDAEALSLPEARAILARKARANIADVLDAYGNVDARLVKENPHAVATYSIIEGENGTSYHVRAADQIKAIELAMKLDGHLDKKQESAVTVGGLKIIMEGINDAED